MQSTRSDARQGFRASAGRAARAGRVGGGARTRQSSSGWPAALRRCWLDESGALSLEYVLVTTICGLLAAIGLIAAVGPSLVATWSDRRACLYDGACGPEPSQGHRPPALPRPRP